MKILIADAKVGDIADSIKDVFAVDAEATDAEVVKTYIQKHLKELWHSKSRKDAAIATPEPELDLTIE